MSREILCAATVCLSRDCPGTGPPVKMRVISLPVPLAFWGEKYYNILQFFSGLDSIFFPGRYFGVRKAVRSARIAEMNRRINDNTDGRAVS